MFFHQNNLHKYTLHVKGKQRGKHMLTGHGVKRQRNPDITDN